ncbi:MAG TPA: hypothetical protein VGF14_02065 [Alphaproteobacteria bacterium]
MQKFLKAGILTALLVTTPVYAASPGKSTAEDTSVGVNNNVGVNAAGIGVGVGAGVNTDLPDTSTRVRSSSTMEDSHTINGASTDLEADVNAGLDDSEE